MSGKPGNAASSLQQVEVDSTLIAAGILSLPGNDNCNDCGIRSPDWASVSFGILICLQCSGLHRSFGSHITVVRSLKLDSWEAQTESEHVKTLQHGGNAAFGQYVVDELGWTYPLAQVTSASVADASRSKNSNSDNPNPCSIQDLYTSQEMRYYKELLSAKVEKREAVTLEEFKQRPSYAKHAAFYAKAKATSGSEGAGAESRCNSANSSPSTQGQVKQSYSPGGTGAGTEAIYVGSSPISQGSSSAAQRYVEQRQAAGKHSGGLPDAKGSHWVPDVVVNKCMICRASFNIFFRKHHCRKCGICVCATCAPLENTKPILEMGIAEAVRHCKDCYRSPMLHWEEDDVR